MVVDDVYDDGKRASVSRIDEPFKRVRAAVGRIGREILHAVVSPIAPSGEFAYRQQFDRVDPKIEQIVEMIDNLIEAAGLGESADVQLVNDHFINSAAAP